MGDRAARPKVKTPPAPPLAAAESLTIVDGYTTGFGVNPARAVARRLPVQPGDTVVRFSARLVTTQNREAEFRGEVRVGVPGREVTVATIPRAKELVEVTVANAPSRYEGPATTIEVPLPLGTNPEVSFQVAALPPTCSAQPPGVAVIIDDLRVE
jgi:hypothetical protein